MFKQPISNLFLLTLLILSSAINAHPLTPVTFDSADKTKIHAYWQPNANDPHANNIVLFHQAGASARGEYKTIIKKLSSQGFNVLAVDLRSGGGKFGGTNQTANNFKGEKPSYCEAYSDMVASLNWLDEKTNSSSTIVWGSSYSAGLVFKLAAEHQAKVDAVIGFSPASGKPMANCRAEPLLAKIKQPALALRPESEINYPSVVEQAKIFKSHGIPYLTIKNGVHGSSMLVEARTKHNMKDAWVKVLEFLNSEKI